MLCIDDIIEAIVAVILELQVLILSGDVHFGEISCHNTSSEAILNKWN